MNNQKHGVFKNKSENVHPALKVENFLKYQNNEINYLRASCIYNKQTRKFDIQQIETQELWKIGFGICLLQLRAGYQEIGLKNNLDYRIGSGEDILSELC